MFSCSLINSCLSFFLSRMLPITLPKNATKLIDIVNVYATLLAGDLGIIIKNSKLTNNNAPVIIAIKRKNVIICVKSISILSRLIFLFVSFPEFFPLRGMIPILHSLLLTLVPVSCKYLDNKGSVDGTCSHLASLIS